MFKLSFIGAGSTIFAQNVIGDLLISKDLYDYEIALYDIDHQRLNESYQILEMIKHTYASKAKIVMCHDRKEALKGSNFIVNAIQVGGYEPSTKIDFDIPKQFGLRQTIGDTLGVGGIFRALRTIHVLESMAEDIKAVCPNALFLNYTNPMAILTGYLIRYLGIRTIGLCHSVQACVKQLFETLEMSEFIEHHQSKIAGINHQAWLLEIKDRHGNGLYPEIKKRSKDPKYNKDWDLVRHDMMDRFGYYMTESSEHTAEYVPWYIKNSYPELIDCFKIPLDEYPRRLEAQIKAWDTQRDMLMHQKTLEHTLSHEYALPIIRAVVLNQPVTIHGNVMNDGYILNLPSEACVEVPCLIDKNRVQPCFHEALPLQCAAINMSNIHVQLLTMEGAYKKDKDLIYQAAYMDPHMSSELSMDDIRAMCDALFDAHRDYLPTYEEKSK